MAPTCVRRGGVGARASEEAALREVSGDRWHRVLRLVFQIPHSPNHHYAAAGQKKAALVPAFVNVGCKRLRTAGSWTSLRAEHR